MAIGIVSYSHTNFGVLKEDIPELVKGVVEGAISKVDKGIDPKEIDLIVTSCVDNQFSNQHQTGTLAWRYLKNPDAKGFKVEAACASGSLALFVAREMVRAGFVKNAMIVGFEKMSNIPTDKVTSILIRGGSPEERMIGITQPAAYGFMAKLYMEKYGATEDDYALVAVKNHDNAMRNPWAQFHKKITIEDVKNSKMIASPIRLLHCSPIADGAAAIILSGEPKRYTDTPVYIKSMAIAHDTLGVFERADPTFLSASKKAADEAYMKAGLKPSQIQFAEVHDAFAPAEIQLYEAIGFSEKGEGYKLIRDNVTAFSGSRPVNVSGGLKAKGHPIGATGVGMMIETFLQLRGEAGERQLPSPEIGLIENHGGTGAVAAVTILGR